MLPCQSDQLGDMQRGTIGTSSSLVLELEDDDSLNSFSGVVVEVSSLVSDFVSDLVVGLVDG